MENEKSREMRLLGRNFIKIKARQTVRTERQTGPHPHHFSGPIKPGFKISFHFGAKICSKVDFFKVAFHRYFHSLPWTWVTSLKTLPILT